MADLQIYSAKHRDNSDSASQRIFDGSTWKFNARPIRSGRQRIVALWMVFSVAAILILCIGLSISASGSNIGSTHRSIHWIASEPIPAELARHTLLADDSHQQLCIIGGALASGTRPIPVDSVYTAAIMPDGRLSPWVLSSSTLPIALFNAAAVISGNQVVVLGGFGGPSYKYLDTVVLGEVDPLTDHLNGWRISTHTLPRRIAAHTAAEYDGSIYVIGGLNVNHPTSEVYVASIEELDGSGYPWAPATSLPRAIHSHSTVISSNVIYVIGGYEQTSTGGVVLDSVYYGRIGSSRDIIEWNSTTPLPTPLRYSAAAISGDYLYVIGGYQEGTGPSSAIFRASIQADGTLTSWISLSQEPSSLPPLYRHAAVTTRAGRIYVAGGDTGSIESLTYLNHVHFTPLLDFEKLATPSGSVTYGDTITYTLKLANLGVRDLEGLTITDTVHTDVAAVLEFRDLPDPLGECRVYSDTGNTITCTCDIQSLALGARKNLTLAVTISQPTTASLFTLNSLQDPSGDADSSVTHQGEQDSISGVLMPDCSADLGIEKVGDPDELVQPGERLTYTLIITNNGPSVARDVSVLDYLPPDLELVATTPPTVSNPGSFRSVEELATAFCRENAGKCGKLSSEPLRWRLDLLRAGQREEIQIVTEVISDSEGTILNVAMVLSDIDTNRSNDVDGEWTAIGSLADLGIGLIDDPDPVSPGDTLTYTLLITNAGPSEATNVIVTDTLPAGVCGLDCLPPNCCHDPLMCAEGTVVCDLGTVSAGEREEIRMRVTVCPSYTDTLTNAVEVRSKVSDIRSDNNEYQGQTDILLADLCMGKSGNPNEVTSGDALTYTLWVTNSSSWDARDVVVSDTLPSGVTFHSSVPTLTSGFDPLVWYTDVLTAGGVWTIEVVVVANPGVRGLLINTADVTSKTFDPDSWNNHAEKRTTAPVPVVNQAYICEGGLWCKESMVINSPFNVYLPIIFRASSG